MWKFTNEYVPNNTHGKINEFSRNNGHTLDLVITRSDDSLIKDTKVKDPVISDHLAIHCVLSIQKPQFRKKIDKRPEITLLKYGLLL